MVEVIDDDFGTNQRHGLEREYRTAELRKEGMGGWRVLNVENVAVRMDDRWVRSSVLESWLKGP